MGQDRKPPKGTPDFREKAEANLPSKVTGFQDGSLDEVSALVSELQVHQIELEMQNETLRQTQTSLEEAIKKYGDFYDFAPVGFLTLTESGLIREVNLTAARQLGVTRDHLIDKPFQFFIEGEDRDRFRLCLKRLFLEPGPHHCEIRLRRPGGGTFFGRLDSVAVQDAGGEPVCRTSITDVTELKQAEQKLQESEQLFASFMEHLPSVAVIRDLEGRYLFANAAWEQTMHQSPGEWRGKTNEDHWPPEVAARFKEQDRIVMESGESLQSLVPLPHPDGLHHWIFYRFPIVDQDGQPVMIGLNAIDVTEFMETKARLEQILAISPAAIYALDPGKNFADSRFWLNHVHPEDRPQVCKRLALPWPQDHQSYEYRFLAQDGAYRWVHDKIRLVRDADGKPVEMAGVWMDITARKQMEEALKETENQYRLLVNQLPAVVFKGYADWSVDFFDDKIEALTGYSKEEFDSRRLKWFELILPEDSGEVHRKFIKALTENHVYVREYRIRKKDGSICWIQARGQIFCDAAGQVDYVSGVFFDITERKHAEEALWETRNYLENLLDYANAPIIVWDAESRITRFNHAFENLTGFSAHEVMGQKLNLLFPEASREESLSKIASTSSGERWESVEIPILRKDGDIRIALWNSANIHAEDGATLVATIAQGQDITERKVAETIIHQERQRFFSLLDMLPASVCLVAPDFTLAFANRLFRESFGDPKDRTCYELMHGRPTPCDDCNTREILETQKPVERERTTPEDRTYHVYNYPFADIDGSPMVLKLGMNITERKALEAQLLQAQKMEAVGRLAGGVAHDFNNLLMAIMGYGELIRSSLVKDDPLYRYSEDILKASERAASLTQQLLAFSRQQVMQPQVLNLTRVVADLEKMLGRLIGEHIDLGIEADPDLGAVKADPGQIGQVIMNLAVNARDAMPTGGRLTLNTANINFANGHKCPFDNIPPGSYVRLAVTDTGSGMDAETLNHIFEPFFTTKEVGKGTGLGLSMVYGIVKQNRGYLEVDSRPGHGATFMIYLPRIEAPVEAPEARISLAAKLEGSETILLVEDEDALRTLLCRFFRLFGYNVLEARHGGEALLLSERHRGPIHLMVTDVVMPQMSGKELADRLAPLHPEMTVFFMSGYTDSDLSAYGAPESSQHFLPKPFRPMDLVKKVRDSLDASQGVTAESPPP
jgi:PAS domain S-box-containing protein